ncbi:MAG: alpha/beta fold hydrolase [Calditrichia bacterium]
MRKILLYKLVLIIAFGVSGSTLIAQNHLQYADLGDFRLENDQTILQCRIGYHTFGSLNEEKSNAVLFPTWFGGLSGDLAGYLGEEQLVDSAKYFVILVDALGNGTSSSPSNSKVQPNDSFPEFTIKDMVNTQFQLLKEQLGIAHLRAVIGISMGANQALQWMVQYPDFMDKIIAIAGTTEPTPYDKMISRAFAIALETGREDPNWERDALRRLGTIHSLLFRTPKNFADLSDEACERFCKGFESYVLSNDPYDYIYQARAEASHNIFKDFNGSSKNALNVIKAKLLVINAADDHLVFPDPAVALAEALNGQTLLVDKNFGHASFFGGQCDMEGVNQAVSNFLEK